MVLNAGGFCHSVVAMKKRAITIFVIARLLVCDYSVLIVTTVLSMLQFFISNLEMFD